MRPNPSVLIRKGDYAMTVKDTIKKGVKSRTTKWTARDVKRKMMDIAALEKCELVFLTDKEGLGGCNYAAVAGKDTIMLAPFIKVGAGEKVDGYDYPNGCDNPVECQFISFFHELAHAKLTNKVPSIVKGYSWNDTSNYQFEMWITMLGIEYAHKKYGIKFSDQTVKWMMEEAKSYIHSKDAKFGSGLCQMKADEKGYVVKSQWEFQGDKK